MKPRTSALFLALTASLSAQAPVQLETATPVGVFSKGSAVSSFDGVPQNTPIQNTLELSAGVPGGTARMTASLMGNKVSIIEQGHALGWMMTAGTTASTNKQDPAQGPHALVLAARAQQGQRARLALLWRGTASGDASVAVNIDVDGDQKPDFSASAKDGLLQRSLDVRAGASGFEFLIAFDAMAQGDRFMRAGSYEGLLDVMLVPHGRCDVVSYGVSCGPVLDGYVIGGQPLHTLVLTVDKAAPNAYGLILLGDQKLDLKIPNTDCWLHTNILALGVFQTDAQGGAKQQIPFVDTMMLHAFLQDAIVLPVGPSFDLKTTNGLQLGCGGR